MQGDDDAEAARFLDRLRAGDDRAFEALYARYQRRIAGYVFGMVKDYGRAEDITQEVFVSALRRMCQTERPIAFKPWIYEIAKNACIDAYRRGRRAEEVSLDADDRLSPSDYGRLVATGPGPDAAVDTQRGTRRRGSLQRADIDHHVGDLLDVRNAADQRGRPVLGDELLFDFRFGDALFLSQRGKHLCHALGPRRARQHRIYRHAGSRHGLCQSARDRKLRGLGHAVVDHLDRDLQTGLA